MTPVQRHREGYPWRRVLFGCSVVLLCWGIGLYREYQEIADVRIKQVQDWAYAKTWTLASGFTAERVDSFRAPLWKNEISGNVLEIGPGLGDSLLLLSRERVGRYVALEPNRHFHGVLADNAKRAGFMSVGYDAESSPGASDGEFTIVNGTLDGVPKYVAEHGPYDTVVSSMVLCSVDDLQGTLERIWELLKPGGRFVFVEHVRHTDAMDASVDGESEMVNLRMWGWIQEVVTPVWSLFTGNCHLNRRTGEALDGMRGWEKVRYSTRRSSKLKDVMGPFIYGVAFKSQP
ncbi:hypothetical protein IWW39_004766 [Coemansia spiralis]|uniref:Uncharacterized protein n=1 Tax=Coemansia spiralis TaxID=417178 RepID=A0A9W8GGP7_9FUNG|nr:hypothetical protein IWW39_004766 [Coemansia spiralis]